MMNIKQKYTDKKNKNQYPQWKRTYR